jgi:hypothetical protein
VVGELCDLGALANFAIAVDCALPGRFGQFHDRPAHPLVDLVADREADAGVAAVLREGVGAPADVGASENLATQVRLRKLLERQRQHLEVVGGGVGGGVPGPQDRGQRLACLGQVAEQRVKAEAALVVAGGAFLLGMGDQKRGVDVEDQLLGSGSGIPCLGQRLGAGCADRFEQAGVDRLQHPVGRRLGGHHPEQRLLAAQHAEV